MDLFKRLAVRKCLLLSGLPNVIIPFAFQNTTYTYIRSLKSNSLSYLLSLVRGTKLMRTRNGFQNTALYFILRIWPNPSSRIKALGSTQPLAEMSTRNFPGGKGRPACKADNLAGIHVPTVQKMWEPRCLTTLCASTTCYMDSFIYINGLRTFYTSRTNPRFPEL
jgi:hypothetical protein